MNGTLLYEEPTGKTGRKPKVIYKSDEMMEQEVEDYDSQTFQKKALEIPEPGIDFDPNSVPQNGGEFLMRMLYERKRCPALVVRRHKNCAENDKIAEVNENEQPGAIYVSSLSKEWKQIQAEDFEATRNKIAVLRTESYLQYCDQTLKLPANLHTAEWQKFCCKHEPLLSCMLRLDQMTLERLLEFICEWLDNDENDLETTEVASSTEQKTSSSSDAAAATAIEAAPTRCSDEVDLAGKDRWIGAWLYATLTCLHIPLNSHVYGILRDIARICMRIRDRLQPHETNKANIYNVFINLIAKVYGQLDFAKFV